MKKKLLVLLMLITNAAFAQDQKFTGIGIFKIGSDTSVLCNYALEMKAKVKVSNNFNDMLSMEFGNNNKIEIVRREHNKNSMRDNLTLSFCPDVKEFYVTKYEVSGIIIKKLKLKYYQNKLIRFQSEYSQEIIVAMDTKYGKSKSEVKSDTVNCLYNITGITQKLIAKTYDNIWVNDNIKAVASLYDSYDDHCKKEIHELFYYSIENSDLSSCEKQYLKKYLDDSKPKMSKDKIRDF